MGETSDVKVGTICWTDLTVEDAGEVSDFYERVVGWESKPQDMGGYSDFNMIAPGTGEAIAGVCHARGSNSDLPPQWLMYIVVEDVDHSARVCRERGGAVLAGPRSMGGGRFCVIRDPVGAVCALYKPG